MVLFVSWTFYLSWLAWIRFDVGSELSICYCLCRLAISIHSFDEDAFCLILEWIWYINILLIAKFLLVYLKQNHSPTSFVVELCDTSYHPRSISLSSWMISPITLDIDLQIIQFNETCGLTDLYGDASPSLGTAYHVSGYHPISCCRVLSDHNHVSLIYLPTYNTLLDKVVPSSHGSIYVLTLLGILILCYVSNLLAWDVKQRCFRSRRSTLA